MNSVREIFRSMPAPRPVKCDLVYYPAVIGDHPEFWTIRLYRDDLRSMSGEDQQAIAYWAFDVIRACREVEPNVFHEVLEREESHSG